MCTLQCVRVRWVLCVSSMWRGNRCKSLRRSRPHTQPLQKRILFLFRRGQETGADQVQPSPRKKRGERLESRVLFNKGKNKRVIFSWLWCSSKQSPAEIPIPIPVSLSLSPPSSSSSSPLPLSLVVNGALYVVVVQGLTVYSSDSMELCGISILCGTHVTRVHIGLCPLIFFLRCHHFCTIWDDPHLFPRCRVICSIDYFILLIRIRLVFDWTTGTHRPNNIAVFTVCRLRNLMLKYGKLPQNI